MIERLAASVEAHCDLDALARAAPRARPAAPGDAWAPVRRAPSDARIAIARGPAFSFHYEENLELLRGAGAELVDVRPAHRRPLPDADALILAGGFPEIFGAELSANRALRGEIAAFRGPVLAECGGLLYLARRRSTATRCAASLDATATMTGRLTLGYREVTRDRRSPRLAGRHDRARARVPLLDA